ncbi:MAG TPA: type II toxin-antitoxin system VapC family toxin [Chloroflexota bacterium]|nr:type II toxin-antitoxin system VapC family toxin [Chloroflexota bacterium]
MAVVVDASTVIALITPDPRQHAVAAKFQDWFSADEELHAPAVLANEVANVLARLVWDGIYDADDVPAAWVNIHLLGLVLHPFDLLADGPRIAAIAAHLRRRHATDCAYLSLSETLGLELWTLDGPLSRAGKMHGFAVQLIG